MQEKRVKEKEIIIPALKIIKDRPGINTSQLIQELEKIIELYPGDKEILDGRRDTRFSQIVRNLISHKENNKFGKCIQARKEGRNTGFYINEIGEVQIQGDEQKKVKQEREDTELQRKIRQCKAYMNKKELEKANTRVPEKKSKSSNGRYKTDPRIAKTVLKENNYICEIEKLTGQTHKTFDTNENNPYMEGHHLIPMKAQKNFTNNIDRTDNICCLCPNCHRAIHYGTFKEKKDRLLLLYSDKISNLQAEGIQIDLEELINTYYL